MMSDDDQPLSVEIPASPEYLDKVKTFVQSRAEAQGLSQQAAYDIVLAVEEAVVNIIRHGYKGDPKGRIQVETQYINGLELVVRILDEAPPFDPTAVEDPDFSIPPLQRKLGGLGIYMMKQSVDDLRYRRLPDGRNELTLIKRVAQDSE